MSFFPLNIKYFTTLAVVFVVRSRSISFCIVNVLVSGREYSKREAPKNENGEAIP